MKKRKIKKIWTISLSLGCLFLGSLYPFFPSLEKEKDNSSYRLEEIPEYNNNYYVILNDNKPNFTEEDYKTEPFEKYSELDTLNRAGVAFAHIDITLMPTEERKSIGNIKPSGWHTIKYKEIDGLYLYNRCHLIAYQLTGENANEKNLITCTRTTNTLGMLPFENKVAEYIKKTKNHVLYRVTPIFKEQNLVASGIEIEAASVEEKDTFFFHVYVYNAEPGILIDYKTGDSQEKKD